MKEQELPGINQQDLDENMRIYRIEKFFKGGSSLYYALLPKNKRVKKGMWEAQLEEWGENTSGGHSEGYRIYVKIVKKIPMAKEIKSQFYNRPSRQASRLYFNEELVEERKK